MTSRGAPVVSIVTPFYNTSKYLEECIASVLGQTYSAFEYVLLDNCSTDGASDIAARFAAQDSRIRLIRNSVFLDQVDNYNAALAQISPASTYCKLVQADDFLFKRCVEEMVGLAARHPTIGIVSAFCLVGRNIGNRCFAYPCEFITGREACRQALLGGFNPFGSPTDVMFRSDIVRSRKPFYQRTSPFEDTDACYEVLTDADFGFVHQVLTFTREDPGSIWGRMESYNHSLLARYCTLCRYGPRFLGKSEWVEIWQDAESHYYRYLGEQWLRRREPDFWAFHAKALEQAEHPIDRSKVMRYALRVLLGAIGNPLSTFRNLAGR